MNGACRSIPAFHSDIRNAFSVIMCVSVHTADSAKLRDRSASGEGFCTSYKSNNVRAGMRNIPVPISNVYILFPTFSDKKRIKQDITHAVIKQIT